MKLTTKRILSLLLAIAMIFSLGLAGCTDPEDPTDPTVNTPTDPPQSGDPDGDEYYLEKQDGYNQVTIYWDYKEDISTAGFWIWWDDGAGFGYPVYKTAYGCKVMVNVPEGVESIGFIACYNCKNIGNSSWLDGTKDYEADRFAIITGKDTVIYLKRGDANQYESNDGGKTLQIIKKLSVADFASFNSIKYNITPATRFTSLDQFKVYEGDRLVPITSVSTLNNKVNHGVITLGEQLDLSKTYTLELEGFGKKVITPSGIFDTPEFIQNYTYDGNDLGPVINADGSTTFKVWAPTASKLVLKLFTAGDGVEAYKTVDMVLGERGVWSHTEPNCGHGTYYTYTATTCNGTQETTDPYAKAAGVNGNRSMVVDLDRTDPGGWASDSVVKLEKYTDATIWEIHVRDFSNNIAASQYKGKYLAFTESGLKNSAGVSVGIDYLVDLGITHVHLLPVYDYATVDESKADSPFNWGYDPKNYNVPEGSYSTDPFHGEVRINEFKQMVQALHAKGIGVIMDVVYNHTYDANSSLNKLVPYYYYRYTASGANSSASGCGNDTASERYMYRKYMVDSVSYWAKEYNLDGFRFDLMGLHDLETMRQIEVAVHKINPNAIIYGEGWTMGSTIDGSAQANQSNISQIRPSEGAAGSVAVFNDATRDGLKGSVFNKSGAYINGILYDSDGNNTAARVQFGIRGGSGVGASWQVTGAAVINYMSAHDNNTLWDRMQLACPDATKEELLSMNRLGAAILMISKGTPFWQAGEEMLRTKPGENGGFDENSYKSSDAVNNLKWETLVPGSSEYEMVQYYKGLIEMRKSYEIFRSNNHLVSISFGTLPGGGMTVSFTDMSGNRALVLINPTATADTYNLGGEWKLIANGTQAGDDVIATESGNVTVEARSVRIYVNH